MFIKEITQRIHLNISKMVRGNEMPLTREAVQKLASDTSAKLTAIISDKNESVENKRAASNVLVAMSRAEKDLDDNLSR